MDRASLKLRDCGMELVPKPSDFRDNVLMLDNFPHLIPGTSKPFDAYLGGWAMAYDPDVTELFHSSRITTESHPGPTYLNYIGFADPRVDRLLDEGLATYDQARRKDTYRELQRILAEEQPYLFLFAFPTVEVVDKDLASTSGELDFNSPNWWWQLETLINPAE
jgi:peptide/nickel transport system substrate-binding protein